MGWNGNVLDSGYLRLSTSSKTATYTLSLEAGSYTNVRLSIAGTNAGLSPQEIDIDYKFSINGSDKKTSSTTLYAYEQVLSLPNFSLTSSGSIKVSFTVTGGGGIDIIRNSSKLTYSRETPASLSSIVINNTEARISTNATNFVLDVTPKFSSNFNVPSINYKIDYGTTTDYGLTVQGKTISFEKGFYPEGAKIYYRITGTANSVSKTASSYFVINNRPEPPSFSDGLNSIKVQNSFLNDGLNYTLNINLGSDKDNAATSLYYIKGEDNPLKAMAITSPVILTSYGDYYFYCKDDLDFSDSIKFSLIQNQLPFFSINPSLLIDETNQFKDEIIVKTKGYDPEEADIIYKYYIRSAKTISELDNAPPFVLFTNPEDSDDIITTKIKINPLQNDVGLKPGYYYQIKVGIIDDFSEDEQYSDWLIPENETSPPQILLGISSIATPQIFNSDNLQIGMSVEHYKLYFKNNNIKVIWTTPELPDGVEKLYYEFIYYDNINPNGFLFSPNRIEFNSSTYIEQNLLLSNLKTGDLYSAADNCRLTLKAKIYLDATTTNVLVESELSNILLPCQTLIWDEIYNQVSYVNGSVIKPNSNSDATECINITIPYASSVCELVERKQDLMYRIDLLYKDKTYNFKDFTFYPQQDMGNNFKEVYTYADLKKSYKTLFLDEQFKQGPYEIIVKVTYRDAFNNLKSTSINNEGLKFIIDFREPPNSVLKYAIGRDGIYTRTSADFDIQKFINTDTQFYPTGAQGASTDYSLINNERVLITFNANDVVSYDGQKIDRYILTFYTEEGMVYKTLSTSVLKTATTYGDIPESIQTSIDPTPNYVTAVFYLDNIFTGYNKYTTSLKAIDVLLDVEIGREHKSNIVLHCGAREEPKLILEEDAVDIRFSTSSENGYVKWYNYSGKQSLKVTWPNIYDKTKIYNRVIKYNTLYQPTCNYYLEISSSPDFTTFIHESLPLVSNSNENYSQINYNTATEITFSDSNMVKLYIRVKVEYTSGLQCINNTLSSYVHTVYSNILSFTGKSPTFSYRENAIGINEAPKGNEVFKVLTTQNKNVISFAGDYMETLEDSEGNNVTTTYFRQLNFDFSQGKIITNIKNNNGEGYFELDPLLIPLSWIATTKDIQDAFKSLTFDKNSDIINI